MILTPSKQWGVCDKQYSSIGSDNGLAPARQQAITWTNDD